jgi:hypothetical protein
MRDAGRGGGYDYQWDVCSSLLLSAVLGRADTLPQLASEFLWLGPIKNVSVEGGAADDGVEDVTFWSEPRCLTIQIKEQPDEGKKWKKGDKKVLEFLNRAALNGNEDTRRYVFLSNGDVERTLERDVGSEDVFNRISAHMKEALKDPVIATREQVAKLPQTLEFRRYLPPSDASSAVLRDGVRFATQRVLHDAGVNNAPDAYRALYEFVKDASLKKGGTRWTLGELREAVKTACGFALRSLGDRGVIPFIEFLQARRRRAPGSITWDTLADDKVLSWDDATLVALEQKLATHSALVILGGRGSGKSVLAYQLAYRAVKHRNALPIIWDLESFGERQPDFSTRLVAEANSFAQLWGGAPFAIIENAHLDPEMLSAVASVRGQLPDVPLLVTSRTPVTEKEFPVDHATVDLRASTAERGQRILRHHLQQARGLAGEELAGVLSAADWGLYTNDLVVLTLALEAFDFEKLSLSLDGFHRYFDERLEVHFRQQTATDDLAFYLAFFGQYGLSIDLRAVARVLGCDEQVIRTAADALYSDGLILFDARQMLARFGHDSFADAVYRYLQFRSEQWASKARGGYTRSVP